MYTEVFDIMTSLLTKFSCKESTAPLSIIGWVMATKNIVYASSKVLINENRYFVQISHSICWFDNNELVRHRFHTYFIVEDTATTYFL